MRSPIPSDMRNRVSYTLPLGEEVFYLMVHDNGQLLLSSNKQYRSCRLDLANLNLPRFDGRGLHVCKYSSEAKLNVDKLSREEIGVLVEHTGMSVNGSPELREYFGSVLPDWYGRQRNIQAPMFQSVLVWAKKHPKLAKAPYVAPLIESVASVVEKPLPLDMYSGF